MTTISDYMMWTANDVVIDEPDIHLDLTKLNYATFTANERLTIDTDVTIYYENIEVFKGTITNCKQLARTIDGKTKWDCEAVEYADDLNYRYLSGGDTAALYVKNTNTNNYKTLGQMVRYILDHAGCTDWIDISDQEYKDKTMVSIEGQDDTYMPSMGFGRCNVWNALYRVIVNNFGLGMWFDYSNGIKSIRYGEHNKTATGFPVPINIKVVERAVNGNVDGIIVYNSDRSLHATQGTLTGKILIFEYSNCQSQNELNWVAYKIYQEKSSISYRYEIEFPIGWYNVREGDLITIYDNITGLAPGTHGIKDVRFRQEKTIVAIGAAEMTIFDILDERLTLINDEFLDYEDQVLDTGYITINPSRDIRGAIVDDEYGIIATASCYLPGNTIMDSITFYPYFDDGESGLIALSVGAAASEMHTSVEIGGTADSYIAFDTFSEESFPWDWTWVEMEVSFIFNESDNEENTESEWECIWPGLSLIEDGVSYQTASSTRRTIIHKWYISEQHGVPYSYPTFYLYLAGDGGDTVYINDVTIKVTFFWNKVPSGNVLTAQCTTDMRIRNASEDTLVDWFTIFDWTDPSTYLGASYDIDTDENNISAGEYIYIDFRAKTDALFNVRVIGEYKAFDVDTDIVS